MPKLVSVKDVGLPLGWPDKRIRKLMGRFAQTSPVSLTRGDGEVPKIEAEIVDLRGFSIGLPGDVHDFVLWFCDHHMPTMWVIAAREIDHGYWMPCYFCPNEKMDA